MSLFVLRFLLVEISEKYIQQHPLLLLLTETKTTTIIIKRRRSRRKEEEANIAQRFVSNPACTSFRRDVLNCYCGGVH